jgi:internalin A
MMILFGQNDLINLKNLMLSDNNVKSAQPLVSLINLENLQLDNNNISTINGLGALQKLRRLRLSENHISVITELGKLKNLEALAIAQNQVTDLSPLSGLMNLRTLNISNNKIKDITPVRSLPHLPLTVIVLYGNPLPNTVFEEILKDEYILNSLSPTIADGIKSQYGELRQYMDEGILKISQDNSVYQIVVQLETFVGAHNPPYGLDVITIATDGKTAKIENYQHTEEMD